LGRATKDAEKLESKGKKTFAKTTIAVNEYNSKTKEEKSFFYDVLFFGKTAEKAAEKIQKGDLVFLNGKPTADAYLSKKDKEPKASISVFVDNWQAIK
jgi:single-stranded DNA-binding protein